MIIKVFAQTSPYASPGEGFARAFSAAVVLPTKSSSAATYKQALYLQSRA
jgi:hypothetical protein